LLGALGGAHHPEIKSSYKNSKEKILGILVKISVYAPELMIPSLSNLES